MQELLSQNYEWLRALHIISIIAWMAGMLYLPRLFVYHAEAKKGSDKAETFKVMERRLLKVIMNPAFVAAWLFGGLMLWANPALLSAPWMHVKLTAIVLMTGLHHVFAKWVKVFAADQNTRAAKFYRIMNEVPTALMIIIVIMAVAQPF
ncbi:MAG: protoporphyrinogen oxidase HemJ [Alphaproteobacteria bacterium]|nr:protoporphyrinogen oxidase HemJ [Alphaproteobacteria bacterium]